MEPQRSDNNLSKGLYSFAEAIELTGNGKFQLFVLWTTGIALLGILMESQNMGLVLPLAKCELSLSNADQSAVGSVTLIGVVLTSHFWGFLADTWGRRKVLLLSLGSGFTFSVISSFSVSGTMLIVTRLFVGLTISGVAAAAVSFMGEFYSNRDRSRSLIFAALFMSLTMCYQGAMGLFFMPMNWQFNMFGMVYRPWRAYILFSSCIHAISFICIAILPESPRFLLTMGKAHESLVILKNIHRTNNGLPRQEYPVQEISVESIGSSMTDVRGVTDVLQMLWRQTKPLLHKPHVGNLSLLGFLNFVMFATAFGIQLWFPQIMSLYYENMDISITTCSAIVVGFNTSKAVIDPAEEISVESVSCRATGEPMTYYIIVIVGVVTVLLISLLALNVKRTNMKYLMSMWVLLSSVASVALYWTNNFYLNIVLLSVIMANAGFGGIFVTFAADMFPTQYKGMALSLVIMVGRLGCVAGVYFVGALLQNHCEVIFIIVTICLLVAALVSYYVLR